MPTAKAVLKGRVILWVCENTDLHNLAGWLDENIAHTPWVAIYFKPAGDDCHDAYLSIGREEGAGESRIQWRVTDGFERSFFIADAEFRYRLFQIMVETWNEIRRVRKGKVA